MNAIVLAGLLFLTAPTARAAGTASGEFLRIGAGARAAGMGDAFTAVADDATALYWNPAGLSAIEGQAATFMHAPYIASSRFDYAAYAHSLGRHGALAGGFQHFSLGKLTQTDPTGTDIGSISPYGLAASLGYAHTLPDYLPLFGGGSLGGSLKFIQSKILDTAASEAADVGFLSRAYAMNYYGHSRFQFALAATNMGRGLSYGGASDPLPTTLALGSRLDLPSGQLLALDAKFPKGAAAYVCFGTEYWIKASNAWRFALRGGFDSQTLSSIDGLTGISMGFGIAFKEMSVDYAFTPYGSLGQAQRISLSCRWGGKASPNRDDQYERVRQHAEESLKDVPLPSGE